MCYVKALVLRIPLTFPEASGMDKININSCKNRVPREE